MKAELPPPMLPASCDLRKFPDMPLDVVRLRNSETRIRTKAEAFRAALLIWGSAWHGTPAGSVPDDDVVLSDMAGFGAVVKEWRKVKAEALRGFVKCSDGRLYHPVIVAKAIPAWRALLERRHQTECGRMKKDYQRRAVPDAQRHYPTFDLWITSTVPEAAPYMSLGTSAIVPGDKTPCPPDAPPVSPEKRLLTDRIQNNEDLSTDRFPGGSSISASSASEATGREPDPDPEVLARVLAELRRAQVADVTGGNEIIRRLMREGATPTQFARACTEARQPGAKPHPQELRIGYVEAILKRVMRDDGEARKRAETRVRETLERGEALRSIPKTPMPDDHVGKIVMRKAGRA